MQAYEVDDGFDQTFCATLEDAEMVAREYRRRLGVIGSTDRVTIRSVEIGDIPEAERQYVEDLRKHMSEEATDD